MANIGGLATAEQILVLLRVQVVDELCEDRVQLVRNRSNLLLNLLVHGLCTVSVRFGLAVQLIQLLLQGGEVTCIL